MHYLIFYLHSSFKCTTFVLTKKQELNTLSIMETLDFKTATKEEILVFLEPLIEYASKMLLNGVLKKNVIKFFTNRSISLECATNLLELSEKRAEQFSFYKFK